MRSSKPTAWAVRIARAVFFLRSKAREATELGYGETAISKESGFYRLVTFEAVINEVNGEASPPLQGEDAFAGIESRTFSEVVSQLRALGP